MNIHSLGYARIESADPSRWRDFATQVLGLMEVQGPASEQGTVYFKMDERPWRFAICPGSEERLVCAGWELGSASDFHDATAWLKGQSIATQSGSTEECQERGVRELLRCQDPAGNTLELYWGGGLDFAPMISPLGVSHFVTGDEGSLGLGHLVLPAGDLEVTHRFYRELGFGDSDYMEVPNPQTGGADGIRFMHADNARHHSVALYGVPAWPGGCVHMMVEVPTVDDVGRCLERVGERDIHVFSTLGRHSNDRMLSFYMMTPSGFAMEYGCQGRLMDWDSYQPSITTGRGSFWGHAFQMPEMPAD